MPQNGLILLVLGITLAGLTLYELTMGNNSNPGSPLSVAQVYALALAAGFSGTNAVIATAIAFAESGGNPNAQGDYGDPIAGQYNAFGLWQINTGENPSYAGQNLFDPATNAAAAYAIAEGGDYFSRWSTYASGAYQQFVSQVEAVL